MWLDQPETEENVARIMTRSGLTKLKAFNDSTASFSFICQGSPATPFKEMPQFAPPCLRDPTSTETTTTSNFEETSSLDMTSVAEDTSALSSTTSEMAQTDSKTAETSTSMIMSSTEETTSQVILSMGNNETASTMTSHVTSSNTDSVTDATSTSVTTSDVQNSISTVMTPTGEQTSAESLSTGRTSCTQNCTCDLFNYTVTWLSEEDTEQVIQDIEENLLLNKTNLSSTVRRLTSAADDRPSACVMGGCGIIVLVVTAVLIIAPDATDAVKFMMLRFRLRQTQMMQ
ncbi:uncharacterized protein [Littorina saxatilis]|uniref:uncharacterized protein n=1 Tax=Littorina saxatilis TaxID=31220 RepID=UPI0038B48F39